MPLSGSLRTDPAIDRAREEFAADVRAGLSRPGQKELPSKYLYDELGTALFEAITHLPEYGLTRADTRLLAKHARDIAGAFEGPLSMAEFGSGTGHKSKIILEAATANPRFGAFRPIDISADALSACARHLSDIAPVFPVLGTYLEGLAQVTASRRDNEKLLVLFLGSTIGNFERRCAEEFLLEVHDRLQPGDGLLIGADLVKPVDQLLLAYDDPAGVTAAFNRNLLGRINRELGADIDLRAFHHEARYNEREQRVEMHLCCTANQDVAIPLSRFRAQIRAGETIWTESSHKFERRDLDALAHNSGFVVRETWVDEEWPFAETLWIAA